ncbi:flagellar assembly protein T N-terminal domain-containing protein [Saccharospirillum sp. HFRX-1]|uniref:flagellar assembly protein T N-terminal domain-containing protein n=1 Tax=unclassified Saccharospirillum TaxID=2633430 RepID=UPI00371A835D
MLRTKQSLKMALRWFVATVVFPLAAISLAQAEPMPSNDGLVLVDAVGEAEIQFGDTDSARIRALRQAIESASVQVSAQVHSTQVMENGNLTVDYLRVNSAARVTDIHIMSEGRQGNMYQVSITARVSSNEVCANVMANHYRKTVAVTGFQMDHPEQSTMGHLGSVDRELAAYFVNGFGGMAGIRALNANTMTLYPNSDAAPTQLSPRMTLTSAVDAAKNLGAQFVISGAIRELAMEDPHADQPKIWDGMLSRVGIDRPERTRHFVFDIFVHDGYSGALVFQSRYSTYGEWNEPRNARVGFATGRFFSTDYGHEVKLLLDQAVEDIQKTIQCQPFMAAISQVNGQRIFVDTGASSGLRPGDFLSVYRTSQHFDRQGDTFWQLSDTRLVAEVKQVQPHFAIAELAIGSERLNLQMDDVVMAW